jgi:muramoyltetrapeptide carboxypeptidase LdcA involved in peptidoglycan recycling
MPDAIVSRAPICRVIGCSDGLVDARRPRIGALAAYVESLGYSVTVEETLFVGIQGDAASAAVRAEVLVDAVSDSSVGLILDVTGGDATSSMLRLLPREIPGHGTNTRYFAISDNTTIHCALARAAPALCRIYWYPTNLVLDAQDRARPAFERVLATGAQGTLALDWVRGSSLRGPALAGNVRCLLKLAGTRFFPEPAGTVLVLESASGTLNRIRASIDQLADMGAISRVAGVILGEFGDLDGDERLLLAEYVCDLVPSTVPVCCTDQIGHGPDTVPIVLGCDVVASR